MKATGLVCDQRRQVSINPAEMPRLGAYAPNRIREALVFQSSKRRLLSKSGQVEHCANQIEVLSLMQCPTTD